MHHPVYDDSDDSSVAYTDSSHSTEEDTEDGASVSSASEDIVDQIFFFDQEFLDSPKTHGTAYLGTCYQERDGFLLADSVSTGTFYRFKYNDICRYLRMYSLLVDDRFPAVEIMKLCIADHAYTVVLKTHWIRLVQRHWKTVYRQRQQTLQKRTHLDNVRYNRLRGNYSPELRHIYGAKGMLRMYSCQAKRTCEENKCV